jgi:hypothetical protein
MRRQPDMFALADLIGLDDDRPCRFRPVLVPLPRAMEALRVRQETVLEWIESGTLLWVWDIALPTGTRRALRFWLAELLGGQVQRFSTSQAIERVIGCAAPELTGYQVEQILFVRRNSVHRAVALGELEGRVVKGKALITRASLVRFLPPAPG